jgi:hypothetical protein
MELLVSGYAVLIDAADAPLLEGRRWFVIANKSTGGGHTEKSVVVVGEAKGATPVRVRLSSLLMRPALGEQVNHLNGDPLDLRRANLSISKRRSQNIDCPFSAERLDQLYWGLGMTYREIGVAAAQALRLKDAVSTSAVRRWLREAGVASRTNAQTMRVKIRRNPELYRAALAKARRVRAEAIRAGTLPKPDASHLWRRKVRRKIARTRRERAKSNVPVRCARVGCAKHVFLYPSEAGKSALHFCSHRCAAIHYNRRRGYDVLPVPAPQPSELPEWLTEVLSEVKGQAAGGQT